MTTDTDLMRWNRAGLTRLQYVDGNAATYLEDLRLALRTQFGGAADVLGWLGPEVDDKTRREWEQRLLQQYHGERRDYAWELLRSYARAVHVLANTADAFGNERYIRTATQWDNVRRLVNMLDYHPAPPASAETWLALLAKADVAATDVAIGTVSRGLAVKNQPTDGSTPLTFETLQDIDVDYRLNRLRVAGFNRAQGNLWIPARYGHFDFHIHGVHEAAEEDLDAATETDVNATGMPEKVSVGDRAVLTAAGSSVAVAVQAIGSDYLRLQVIQPGFSGASWALADLRLHLQPDWSNAPLLNGPQVIEVDRANATVATGDVLVYRSGSSWIPRRVIAVQGTRLQLSGSVSSNADLYRAVATTVQDYGNYLYRRFVLPLERETSTIWNQNLAAITPRYEYVRDADGDSTSDHLLAYVWDNDASAVYYLPKSTPAAFSVVDVSPASLQFNGKPGKLVSGDWLLLQDEHDHCYSHRVTQIDSFDGGYTVSTASSISSLRWQLASGHFADHYAYAGYNRNASAASHHNTDTNSQLTLLLDELPEVMSTGRNLWVVGPAECELVTLCEILQQDLAAGTVTISVKPSLAGMDLPKYATWIYANVVKAGHGESRAQNVLGNGDRIQINQTFTYHKTGIAFEQDADFGSGVRAAIEIEVEGRRWTQIDNLRDASPTDTRFQTELNEDHELVIRFGDGIHGQRLPTGTNNVLITARFGNGVQGNLVAESLDKLKKPHHLLDGVYQPANATGGGDLESTESLREMAPASVLTLERAVSVSDFGHIAQRLSSVWQARAFALPDTPGATDRIEVVLVPAGGGDLGELGDMMTEYLLNHTRPGVQVIVSGYRAILLGLEIKLRVDTTAFDGDTVAQQVRTALYDSFSLQQARLGQSLYRSRVYQVIEAVAGVENVDVIINPDGFYDEAGELIAPADVYTAADGSIRRITPSARQLIYIKPTVLAPVIDWEVADV